MVEHLEVKQTGHDDLYSDMVERQWSAIQGLDVTDYLAACEKHGWSRVFDVAKYNWEGDYLLHFAWCLATFSLNAYASVMGLLATREASKDGVLDKIGCFCDNRDFAYFRVLTARLFG